ncbi:hypothetical protein CEP54_014779 [Fusarium duplospermum]|uniref:Uncharacterized protein n=1 Tax=Fusarium duplospermum TaxID=1325734 RepID=A0A428NTV9_9HYPO|nr:hypothetical protein CEP54_014779 [Fusarium duplospermum]
MTTRTTFIRSHNPAAVYGNQHPLPPLESYEENQTKDNTIGLSIYDIDITIPLDDQRAELKAHHYIELAILAGEAFLAASERMGVPQALRHFVRRQELRGLRQLKELTAIELEGHSFVMDMQSNTGWVDSCWRWCRSSNWRKDSRSIETKKLEDGSWRTRCRSLRGIKVFKKLSHSSDSTEEEGFGPEGGKVWLVAVEMSQQVYAVEELYGSSGSLDAESRRITKL